MTSALLERTPPPITCSVSILLGFIDKLTTILIKLNEANMILVTYLYITSIPYVLGIDNYAVYSLRDIRSLRGNTRLYPIVTKPTDACSSLALQTNGVVFDVNMMKTMRSSTIKSFQTVFANVMSNNVAPQRCTSCTCEYNELFMTSRTVCSAC